MISGRFVAILIEVTVLVDKDDYLNVMFMELGTLFEIALYDILKTNSII